jgi:site-specific recombinase XerD
MEAKCTVDEVIGSYEVHLNRVCGLGRSTRRNYLRSVREFLGDLVSDGLVDLERINSERLLTFVSGKARQCSPQTTQHIATSLRSFLRFLQFNGICDAKMVDAVPTVPSWRQAHLPRGLDDKQIAALLDAIDRSKPIGLRDYAMVVCMSVFGLRAGEVSRLSLDDIDWRKGTVCIRKTKSRRAGMLPLPEAVGRAVAAYLCKGRPATSDRHVFVRDGQRGGASLTSRTVSRAVHRAFQRSGLEVASRGAHVLRHTAATRMIRRGASLKEVADVLRHQSIETTTIYAKVDLPALVAVALPWSIEMAGTLGRERARDRSEIEGRALADVALPWPEVA